MIVCWDASAIVKLVRDEEGGEVAADLWHGDGGAVASTLVIAEVVSALARGHRDGGFESSAYDAAARRCRHLFEEIDLAAVTEARAQRAADLVQAHRLRGADAVHLATALDVADLHVEVVLATWDRRLQAAALDAGVSVAPAVP